MDGLVKPLNIDLEVTKAKQKEFFSMLFGHSDGTTTNGFEAAEALSKSGQIPEALLWMWSGLRDLLLVATQSSTELLLHHDHLTQLRKLAQGVSPPQILDLLDELYQLELGVQRNLNMQLGFERFFIHLRDAIPDPSR